MSRAARSLLIAVAGGAALIIIALIIFVLWSRANSQTILGSVTVSGVSVSGLERADAEAVLNTLESEQAAALIEIFVDDQSTTFSAAEFGYRINTQELLDRALQQERAGGVPSRWRRWLRNLFDDPVPVELHPQSSINQNLVQDLIRQLDQQYGVAPIEGNLELVNGQPAVTYPSPGWLLDSSEAASKITAAAVGGGGTVRLNTVLVMPETELGLVENALTKAQLWVSAPVVLKDPKGEAELIFTAQEIGDATVLDFDPSASPPITLNIDPRLITRKVAQISNQVGDPPVDAYYEIDEDDQVIIHPSMPGTIIDVAKIGDLLEQLAAGNIREGTLPIMDGVQPQTTTADIEMLGIHLVSQYTTYHPCCAARVSNIQLFADKTHNALVPPGETFSLNTYVGKRTVEDGFVKAGTLVRGELVDTVGGGVSQFATTFFNAVFWGGYETVRRKTHSFYFSRYPEGIEATINWPEVDLVFRNDTSSHLLIRTEYAGTSITVKFFSNNDGRTLVGSWKDGRDRLEVVSEGGPLARVVTANVSNRINQIAPPETLYRPNPKLAVGEAEQIQTAGEGWTVVVTRTIQQGEESTDQVRNVRYIPRQEIIEVHPCVMSLLTESGAVPVSEEPSTGDGAAPTGEGQVGCPSPEEAESTELPEGLYERFPELAPEDIEQEPIEEEEPTQTDGEDQQPIEEEDGQPPTDGEDQQPIEEEEPTQTDQEEQPSSTDDAGE